MSRRIALISLGCPKNLVDSEGMVSDFLSRDLEVVVDPADAQVALVNTCGFLASARDESIAALREVAKLKSSGLKALFVTGCMVGHYADRLQGDVPEIDRLVDFSDYARIADLVEEYLPPTTRRFAVPGARVEARLTPAHFAYLKVSEGCNHTCSFCVIPRIRGRMASVPVDDLVARARRLVGIGAKEINVVAQDSTMYGVDLYGEMRLVELLRRLGEIDGLAWIRLLYAYPTEVKDDLIAALAEGQGPLLPYIDVPIQHSSGRLLEAMNRKSSEDCVEQLMLRLRAASPDLTIRTTVIVGFPGEQEEDVEHLIDFIRRHRIDRLGAFGYSHEEGSPAAALDDAIDAEQIEDRRKRVLEAATAVAAENEARFLGKEIEVLVERPSNDAAGARGRSRRDAPEVDGEVVLQGRDVAPGAMVRARVVETAAHRLVANVVDE